MGRYQAICPACGAFGSPEIFLGEAIKREAIAKALRLPHPLAAQIQAYVGLFRPRERGHSIDRVDRILSELLDLIVAEQIARKGRRLHVAIEQWQSALDAVIDRRHKLDLPLKDHAYLLDVAMSHAEKQRTQEERKREQAVMNRPEPNKSHSSGQFYNPAKAFHDQLISLGRTDLINPTSQTTDEDATD